MLIGLRRVIVLLALLSGAAAAVPAADTSAAVPRSLVHVEVFSLGIGSSSGGRTMLPRIASVTWLKGRLRLGASIADGCFGGGGDRPSSGAVAYLPVRVGYTFTHKPQRTALFYSLVQDVYADATVGLAPEALADVKLLFRARVVAETERYGFGVGAEAGIAYVKFIEGTSASGPAFYYAGVRVRLLTGAFGR